PAAPVATGSIDGARWRVLELPGVAGLPTCAIDEKPAAASLPGGCSESRPCRGRAGRRPDPHRARLADALVGVGVIIAARAAWEPCGSHPWQAQHYPWPDHDVDSTTEDEIRERLWVPAAPDSNSGAQPPEVLRRTAEL